MCAKFKAIGTTTINKDGQKKAFIYGNILDGIVKNGMYANIELNQLTSIELKIESVEYLDSMKDNESYVALVIDPTGYSEEEFQFIFDLNIGEEILNITHDV